VTTAGPHLIFPGPMETKRSLLTILVVALFVLTFILQPFRIPSESMERTLLVGDFLLVNKSVYGPPGHWRWLLPYRQVRRGDVIVFLKPGEPDLYLVKRVVGVPGDRIHLRNGVVFRNGQPAVEPYAVYEPSGPDPYRDQFPSVGYTDPVIDPHWWSEMRRDVVAGDLIVPAGEYFVMGDNRNHSSDSRYWGFVPRAAIEGRPFVIYFSLREPSRTDLSPSLPDDLSEQQPGRQNGKLGHETGLDRALDFARWRRMLRIIR
jgi:signal peptidase I